MDEFKYWVNYPFKIQAKLTHLCLRDTKQYLMRLEETKGAWKSPISFSSHQSPTDEMRTGGSSIMRQPETADKFSFSHFYCTLSNSLGRGALRGKMHGDQRVQEKEKCRERWQFGGEIVLGQSAKMRPRTENIKEWWKTSKSPPLSQAGSKFFPTRRWPTND